jgi:hypothetical protein
MHEKSFSLKLVFKMILAILFIFEFNAPALAWTGMRMRKSSVSAALVCPGTFIITSGSTWTVPSNWSASNSIQVIGGGGGGYNAGTGGGGGGGGAYSKILNLALTPSSSVNIQVGSGGTAGASGTDTWFVSAATVMAKAGLAGTWSAGGAGGASA